MKRMLVTTILFVCCGILFSQKYTTDSRRAIKMYEAATKAYQYTQFEKSLDYVDEAIKRDEAFIEAYLFKAQVLNMLNRPKDEAAAYRKAIAIDELFYKYTLLKSAKAHYRSGQYKKALQHVNLFLKVPKIETKDKKDGKHVRGQIRFAIKNRQNPIEINPQPLPEVINRVGDVYWPSMTVDNRYFYFTAKLPLYKKTFQEDIYSCVVKNDSFGEPMPISDKILSLSNEGASFISPDGRYLLFTGCKRNDGFGSCDLYMSVKKDGRWQNPVNLGKKVNSKAWESRPVITSNGKTLYFSSNRKEGYGNADIYMCTKTGETENGYPKWSEPQNLGDSINTPGDEFAPFIHADNQTLYFSSDYHLGMGGQDIFMSTKTGDNQWTKPKNLGYPINKHTDEIGLFIDAPGAYAYFASDNNQDRRSIYRFSVPEEIKPQFVSYVKVLVRDKTSYEPLHAKVNLFNIENGENIVSLKAQGSDGSALVSLPGNNRYGLMVEKSGYMFYSDHFNLKSKNKNFVKELRVSLQPIEKGKSVILNNVFFKVDSYQLSAESRAELKRVKQFLEQNKDLYVEIAGHTDNQGSAAYNQQLSEQRAKSVYNFLIEHGIEQKRLTFKGYGMKKPVESNKTATGRAKNRRTEMTVIKMENQ